MLPAAGAEQQRRRGLLAFVDGFTASGIFVGPDPVEDRVVGTSDALDGSTVLDLGFCEEG